MEKKKVKVEEKISRELLAEHLLLMARDLENGWLEIRSGDKTISLSVPWSLPVAIEAKHKKDKEKLVIEISWREPATEDEEGAEEGFAAAGPTEGGAEAAIHEFLHNQETGPLPEEAMDENSLVLSEPDAEAAGDEPPVAVEMAPLPEEVGPESGSVASEPVEETTEPVINDSPAGEETGLPSVGNEEEVSGGESEPVTEEGTEAAGESKTRPGRRRR